MQEEFAITIGHGTQEKRTCKGIVLKDTVMFPEGGGQVRGLEFTVEPFVTEFKEVKVILNNQNFS